MIFLQTKYTDYMHKNKKKIYNHCYKIVIYNIYKKSLNIYIRCTNRPGICTTNRLDVKIIIQF